MASTASARTRFRLWTNRIKVGKWLGNWFKPHLNDSASFFRERTVRVFSVAFLTLTILAFVASTLLYLNVTNDRSVLVVLLIGVAGSFASTIAVHLRRLNLSAWFLAGTFLVMAYGIVMIVGYRSRLTFPAFMLAFLLWTLVLPRNSLWPLLGLTTAALAVIIRVQTLGTGESFLAVMTDVFSTLLAETIGLYTFRFEFDSRLEMSEKARVQAESANQLKTQFLSNVSHEFRTPLNAINGYTEIMLSGIGGQMSEKHTQYNKKIHANTQQLRLMVDDLLDLARIESGTVEITTSAIAPGDLVSQIVDVQQGLIQGKSITLQMKSTADLPVAVQWDTRKVQQVLINLIGNAIKFTDQGSVEVSISTQNDLVHIAVADTGSGMPSDAPTYIFDKFRQVDSTEGRKHGGNGLGLSITKGLVEQMGGKITVQTALGKGSTFTVTLPRQMKDTAITELKPQ
jgi:signal transduction histidine kinase